MSDNDLIYRKTAKEMFLHAPMTEDEKILVFRRLNAAPAVDAVERGVYDQVAWERDMAIMQLKDIGKSLGEKMDDVANVVRCRECAVPHNEKTGCPKLLGVVTRPDFFCMFGVRGEEDGKI